MGKVHVFKDSSKRARVRIFLFSAHNGTGGGKDTGGSAGDYVRRHQSREVVDRLVSACT